MRTRPSILLSSPFTPCWLGTCPEPWVYSKHWFLFSYQQPSLTEISQQLLKFNQSKTNLGVPTTTLFQLTLWLPASAISSQRQAQPLRTWFYSIWPAEVGGRLIKGEPELHSKFQTWSIVRARQEKKNIAVLPLLSINHDFLSVPPYSTRRHLYHLHLPHQDRPSNLQSASSTHFYLVLLLLFN